MAACCIGGVCIPYSAILPFLAFGLKWLLDKLVASGLLPASWNEKLAKFTQVSAPKKVSGASSSCCSNDETKTEVSSSCGGSFTDVVKVVESVEDWKRLLASNPLVVAKMTATWCKPCKAIQPAYERLATGFLDDAKSSNVAFCTVDVDELDEVAASLNVAMMPTFVLLRDAKVVDRFAGSDEGRLEAFLKQHLVK